MRRRATVGGMLATLLLGALAAGADAQASDRPLADTLGSVTGRVVELTGGSGVSAAELTLAPFGRATVSATNGSFAFRDVPAGEYELTVEHAAYVGYTTDVVVRAGGTSSVRIHLSSVPFSLDPLEVTVRRERLESVGFYERQEEGIGEFFTPERLERVGMTNHVGFRQEIFEDLAGFPGERIMETRACAGPAYYVDGRRTNPDGLVAELSAREVGAVEAYPLGTGLPLFALEPTAMKCGAVLIWTRRW